MTRRPLSDAIDALFADLAESRADAALYLRQWWELSAALGYPDATDVEDADGQWRQRRLLERIAAQEAALVAADTLAEATLFGDADVETCAAEYSAARAATKREGGAT